MMKTVLAAIVSIVLIAPSLASAGVNDTTQLKPKPVYGKEAKVVAYILDNNHYRKIALNDSLSSVILDSYVKSLDNNKTYMTAVDIAAFEKYRLVIDDLTRSENVDVAYLVYGVFRKRFKERMAFVLNTLVKEKFDYTQDEFYETDRDKELWCKSEQELNDVWRKIIKSQALSLKLAGKTQPEIEKTLTERYERFNKSILQFNSEDVFSLYMNSLTEAYDPHTNYLSPRAADMFNQSMSLSLEGIGARLQTDNDYTKVFEIVPGGPAEKSNLIHVNDRIIGVAQGEKGELVDVIGWRIDDVVKLIKGPKGTTVKLQILPSETGLNGKPKIIQIVRDKIKLEDQQAKKSVINYTRDGKNMKLGVITLPSFYMDFAEYQKGNPNYNSTSRDVKRLINELQTTEKVDGIALDLRNNGGGSLTEAIELTGLFIKDGPVVQVKNSLNKVDVQNDDNPSITYNGPLVVLTNRFSASASEIFAGAIQDYHRGVVVGESTFGKGTVQTIIDLKRFINDGEEVGELKLTFQKFYRVTGSSTQHKGVTPDVKLPTALDEEQFGESANPSALPWDEIRGTLFQKTPIINDRVVASLNKSYQTRLKTDKALAQFVSDTEEVRKSYRETKISLNETVRKKEMDEAEKKKNANTSLNTRLPDKEIPKSDNVNDMDDEYLREGLFVLGDLIITKVG